MGIYLPSSNCLLSTQRGREGEGFGVQGPAPWCFPEAENPKGLNTEAITETISLLWLVLSHDTFGKHFHCHPQPQFSPVSPKPLPPPMESHLAWREATDTTVHPAEYCAVVPLRIRPLKRVRQKAKLYAGLVKETSGRPRELCGEEAITQRKRCASPLSSLLPVWPFASQRDIILIKWHFIK